MFFSFVYFWSDEITHPRIDRKCHDNRKEKSHNPILWNRSHIFSHHPCYRKHRSKRNHFCNRGKDNSCSDFSGCIQDSFQFCFSGMDAILQVTMNILYDDNRVIYEHPNYENESKKSNTIDIIS